MVNVILGVGEAAQEGKGDYLLVFAANGTLDGPPYNLTKMGTYVVVFGIICVEKKGPGNLGVILFNQLLDFIDRVVQS